LALYRKKIKEGKTKKLPGSLPQSEQTAHMISKLV